MGFLIKIGKLLRGTNRRGQHTVEYAVMMILIMVGIIIMGRYVIRSWNASAKGWEDSALDSMQEKITEVPSNPLE